MFERKSPRPTPPTILRRGALGSALLGMLCVLSLIAVPASAAATARTAPSAQGGDPLALVALEQAQLAAPDGATSDQFGYSVALDGDTALVGAYGNTVSGNTTAGAVYVFTRTGTTWTQQDKLTATDVAASDYFGFSVALDGDTALIGALGKIVDGHAMAGAAYVFTRTGTTWTQQDKLTATDDAASDKLGYSVALSGDTAVVGADGKLVSGHANAGAAYVFTRTGTSWSQQDKLTASDAAAGDLLGISVAASGDTAVVGGATKTVSGHANAGAAYVFTRTGTSWSQQTELTAADGAVGDQFGYSVALVGDTALVGARYRAAGSNLAAGAAYVFTRSGTTWSPQATLTAADGVANDHFGSSVSLSGDKALVGASGKAYALARSGAAYVFTRTGTSWQEQARMTPSDGADGDLFGCSVALSGTTALVGASNKTAGSTLQSGGAYADVLQSAPSLSLKAAPHSVKVGASVTVSGMVKHFIAGGKTVNICRKVGSKLTRLKQVTITKSGAFKCSIAPKKAGKWVLVATYKFARTTYSSKLVTVKVHT